MRILNWISKLWYFVTDNEFAEEAEEEEMDLADKINDVPVDEVSQEKGEIKLKNGTTKPVKEQPKQKQTILN